jgi:hypothetical protein
VNSWVIRDVIPVGVSDEELVEYIIGEERNHADATARKDGRQLDESSSRVFSLNPEFRM